MSINYEAYMINILNCQFREKFFPLIERCKLYSVDNDEKRSYEVGKCAHVPVVIYKPYANKTYNYQLKCEKLKNAEYSNGICESTMKIGKIQFWDKASNNCQGENG